MTNTISFREANLYLAGMRLRGYLCRPSDEPRSRDNTWNGWETPVMDEQQILAWKAIQDQEIEDGAEIDSFELAKSVPPGDKAVGPALRWIPQEFASGVDRVDSDEDIYLLPFDIEVDGQVIKVWDVSLGLCWEEDDNPLQAPTCASTTLEFDELPDFLQKEITECMSYEPTEWEIMLYRALSRAYGTHIPDHDASLEAYDALATVSYDWRNALTQHTWVEPDEIADDNPQRIEWEP